MTYFISIEELKQNNVINANVDSEYIEPALREAQDIFLREIIGDALYNAIENKINNETLAGKYQILVDQYIKPYLENRMLASLVVPISMKIRNAGVIQQYDQGFNSSNTKEVAYLADYYNGRVEFYENRMTEYLKKNVNDIPEYAYSNQNITNPSQTHTAGTIYLGGGRKRSCGLNMASGGGSVETVDWDDIQNRPNFAEVATSGDYNDLDNRPTIPTVNDSTINIYQGNALKGSFSLNQAEGQNINLDAGGGGGGSTDWSDITNKPNFATVATSGDYNDLSDKPDLSGFVTQMNVKTYNVWGIEWDMEHTMAELIADITADETAEAGRSYLLHLQTTDLPNDLFLPATKVDIEAVYVDGNDNVIKNILFTIVDEWYGEPTLWVYHSVGSQTGNWVNLGGGGGSTDWSDITNKPNFATVATSGDYTDLTNKPTIPAAQVNSDWNSNSGVSQILNKPTLATIATSGSYNDLRDIPSYFSYIGRNSSGNGVKLSGQTEFGDRLDTDISYGVFCNFKVDVTQSTKLYTDYIITGENIGGRNELVVSGNDGNNVYGKIAKDGIYEGTDKLSDKYLQIVNLPTNVSAFNNDAGYTTFDGDYNSLTNKPTIPAAQVQSDWNASSGMGEILNKPTLATVATSGSYNDLTNKPTIPAAQVNSDWNSNSGVSQILNKPSMTTETWTFTLQDNSTVTKTVYLVPSV